MKKLIEHLRPVQVLHLGNTDDVELDNRVEEVFSVELPKVPSFGPTWSTYPGGGEIKEALYNLEGLKCNFSPEQDEHYRTILAWVMAFQKCPAHFNPWSSKNLDPRAEITDEMTVNRCLLWLQTAQRRGRTSALVVAFIEKAIRNEGMKVEFFDHPNGVGDFSFDYHQIARMDNAIKYKLREIPFLHQRFIHERDAIRFRTLGHEAIPFRF